MSRTLTKASAMPKKIKMPGKLKNKSSVKVKK